MVRQCPAQVTSFETAGTTGTTQTFYEELARRLGELEVPECSLPLHVQLPTANQRNSPWPRALLPCKHSYSGTITLCSHCQTLVTALGLLQRPCASCCCCRPLTVDPCRPQAKGSLKNFELRGVYFSGNPRHVIPREPWGPGEGSLKKALPSKPRLCAQRRGALAIAQPKGAPPLPPFERWSFAEMRYVQWLVDMHSVHYALEAAVADATTVAATEHYSSASSPTLRANRPWNPP